MLQACLFGGSKKSQTKGHTLNDEVVNATATQRQPLETETPSPSLPSVHLTHKATAPSNTPPNRLPNPQGRVDTKARPYPPEDNMTQNHQRSSGPKQRTSRPFQVRRDIIKTQPTPRTRRSVAVAGKPQVTEPRSQLNRDIMHLQQQYDELCAKMHTLSTKQSQQQHIKLFRAQHDPTFPRTKVDGERLRTPQPRETLTTAFAIRNR